MNAIVAPLRINVLDICSQQSNVFMKRTGTRRRCYHGGAVSFQPDHGEFEPRRRSPIEDTMNVELTLEKAASIAGLSPAEMKMKAQGVTSVIGWTRPNDDRQ
jgi:hypothetical protein